MSTIRPADEESQPCRENFWGNDTSEESNTTEQGHTELPGTSYEEFVAHAILRHGADMLCPECLHKHDRTTVISDPQEYVPKEVETSWGSVELHVLRHRRRVCTHEDCGYMSFGGVLADRDTDAFLDLVKEVLSLVDLPPSREEKLLNDARSRKLDGRFHDSDNMRRLVQDIQNPSHE